MEATLEAPASSPHQFRINSSNAAELAKRRWAMQREREERDRIAQAEARLAPPKPEGQSHARAILKLEEQLEAIDKDLEHASGDPDAWHKLTISRGKLFEQWRILSGIPMPGSRKPAAEKAQKRGPMPDPI